MTRKPQRLKATNEGGGGGELQRSRFSVSKIKASLFPFRLLLIVFKDLS